MRRANTWLGLLAATALVMTASVAGCDDDDDSGEGGSAGAGGSATGTGTGTGTGSGTSAGGSAAGGSSAGGSSAGGSSAGGSGSGGAAGAATVEELCAKVFDCFDDNWSWDTIDNCIALWLTNCVDEQSYLECAGACLTGDCDDFAAEDGSSGCEPDCWEAHCME